MNEKKIKREMSAWRVAGVFCSIVSPGCLVVAWYVMSGPVSPTESGRLSTLMIGLTLYIAALCILCFASLAVVVQRQAEYALCLKEMIERRDTDRAREDVVKP